MIFQSKVIFKTLAWIVMISSLGYAGHAQEADLISQMSTTYQSNPADVTIIEGYLDNSLPLTIAYTSKDNLLKGLIKYGGSNITHIVEGTDTDSLISLYEFEDATVTAVLSGPPPNKKINWSWSTYDYSMSLPIVVHNSEKVVDGRVVIYGNVSDQDRSQILIRPDRDQISIELENSINLRWMDYACEGVHCIEGRPDMSLDNPVEFQLDDNTVKVYPTRTLSKLHELGYQTISKSDFQNFYSFAFPMVEQGPFDGWIKTLIAEHTPAQPTVDIIEDIDLAERFKNRTYGDFYITLLSKEIISGYLIFHNTTSNRMETVPFNYNLNDQKFYRAKDFFKKEFNYTFFLNSYIEKSKRRLLYKEQGAVKDMVADATFGHYVLSPGGIVFFTDFNTIYGRRHILIPYEELKSFIDDKSLSNYIKKEKYR